MNIKNYVSLKSKSAISFSKADDSDGITRYYVTQKKWDSDTGDALSDSKIEIQLSDYENELSHVTGQITSLTEEKTNLEKIIEDIKAL